MMPSLDTAIAEPGCAPGAPIPTIVTIRCNAILTEHLVKVPSQFPSIRFRYRDARRESAFHRGAVERLRASSDLMISPSLRVPSLAPDSLLESAVSLAFEPAPITFDVRPPPM